MNEDSAALADKNQHSASVTVHFSPATSTSPSASCSFSISSSSSSSSSAVCADADVPKGDNCICENLKLEPNQDENKDHISTNDNNPLKKSSLKEHASDYQQVRPSLEMEMKKLRTENEQLRQELQEYRKQQLERAISISRPGSAIRNRAKSGSCVTPSSSSSDTDGVRALTNDSDFKSLFEAAPSPYLILLPNAPIFTCVGVTELYLKSTLKTREEMIGRGLFQVFPENPHDQITSAGTDNLRSSLMRVIATRKADTMAVQKYDVENPKSPGEWVTKYWTPINTPVWTESGKMYILHRVEDVTEFMELKLQGQDRARAETMQHIKRVEESQARYQRLTTLLPLGIFHARSDGELTYVNKRWEQMTLTDWIDAQNDNLKWYECLPEFKCGDIDNTNVEGKWLAQKSSGFKIEYRHVSPERWFELQIVPEIRTDVMKGCLGYIVDITERKLSEDGQRLRAEQLAELDRSKTVFFSNISHELRTPLTLILGPAEDSLGEIGKQALQPRQRERMEVIQRSAQRLLKLVNSSLDFTRLEEGRFRSEFELTDLADFTEVLARLFRPAMENANLNFRLDIHPISGAVYVDRDLWQKIVFNLLSNSLKYTLKGNVLLSLQQVETINSVRLTVQDTGIGIPEKELPNMFQRFHRVANMDGRSHEGTGIGLSLTQQLVKLHGGTIGLTSELGKGTTFIVTIPLGAAHLPQHMIKESSSSTGTAGPSAHLFVKEAMSWCETSTPLEKAGQGSGGHNTPHSQSPRSSITTPSVTATPLTRRRTLHVPSTITLSSSSTPPGAMAHPVIPTRDRSSSRSDRERSVSPATSQGDHFKILIAEDNRDMRKFLYNLLSREFSVAVVPDGEAAYQAVKQEKFDLIITDLMMPKMDGFQLIKALRSEEKTKTLPIILLSARVDEESRLRGLQIGADDFVVKPFSKRELLERVGGRLRAGRWRHQLTQELHEFQDESQRQKRLLQLVSHELRNPLVGIKGNTEIADSLLEAIEDSLAEQGNRDLIIADQLTEARTALRVVLQCTDYQKIICDDVLDMAKLKEQKMELHLSSFDPSTIVTDAIQMLNIRAQQRDIKLTSECKMKNRLVSGDATRLTQVLVNLISNAIKFTPKQGSISVTLESPSETTERIQLQFIVQDTGMGMSDEQQTKIFSPFTQASSAIAGQFGGTGLGLSISKSLVELMGGHISVKSALGKGSTFTATVFCGNVFVSATPQVTIRKPSLSKMALQVLVVDDTIINQKILKRMLEVAGHQCAVANNGQEGLNMWTQMAQVDVILMDLNMPIMGGLEATRCIRKAEQLRTDCSKPAYIIGLSGDTPNDVEWKAAGMNDYVIKPYNQRDLLEKLGTCTKKSNAG